MDEKKLLKEIGSIDDKFVKEADSVVENKKTKHWIKYVSVAASVCIIAVIAAILKNSVFTGDKNITSGTENYENTEPAIEKVPEIPEIGIIDDNVETVFYYYVCAQNGHYSIINGDTEQIEIEGAVIRFFELNAADEIKLNEIKIIHEDAKEWIEGDLTYHTPSMNTYEVYMDGRGLTDDIAIGLVNTVGSYMHKMAGNKYIKLYLNSEAYLINDEMSDYGYATFDVELNNESDEKYAPDANQMVDVTFVIKDKSGNPMKNIAYHMEYLSGEKGSYQPGYGITDASGTFTRSVHPGAVYILYLQKRNAVIYESYERWTTYEPHVYEEMIVRLEVREALTTEIVWDEEEVIKIAEAEKIVEINISEVYEGSCEDIFVQLISDYGTQIQLGYLSEDGEIEWKDGQDGNYYLTLQKFDKEKDAVKFSKIYLIEIKDDEVVSIEEYNDEMMFLE